MAAAISNVNVTERPRGGPQFRCKSRFRAFFEGQDVRTALAVALLIVCLGPTGCSLFGKKQAAQKNNPKPFLGAEAPAKAEVAALPRDSGPLPGANGVLAGRVVVEATDRPIRASILLKNLDRENAKGADLDLSTNEDGYFYFPKLNAGESYELIARANDNGELISCHQYVVPPRPTLHLRLDKRFTTASTPPLPDMPRLREKKSTAGAENTQEHKPRASIEAPIQLHDPGSQSGAASGSRQPEAPARSNPANIADGGFRRIVQPPSETISIPPPPPPIQQPQWESVPEQPPPGRSVPSGSSGSVGMPNIPTPVPSCLLLGNRLDNFALYDHYGKVWEYKRDRGRLTLLDFWRHDCPGCIHAIPHLVELQRVYGTYGLEVIGIACEAGDVEQQRRNVQAVRGRYSINYKTLLSGGGAKDYYPVIAQFQVGPLPRLVLIDTDGTIIWRNPPDGMDNYAHNELERLIRDRLVARQTQP